MHMDVLKIKIMRSILKFLLKFNTIDGHFQICKDFFFFLETCKDINYLVEYLNY